MPNLNIPAKYASDDSLGFTGMFRFPWKDRMLRVVSSDGMGWQHVSVSVERDSRCPTWEAMCYVKDLFWEGHEVVIQFHPAKDDYINYHPGCLHLWKPIGKDIETPNPIMVGPRKKVAPTQDKW